MAAGAGGGGRPAGRTFAWAYYVTGHGLGHATRVAEGARPQARVLCRLAS